MKTVENGKLPDVFMQYVRAGIRLMMALSLSIWIGGLAFFGIVVAPIMFRTTRENGVTTLGFEMVGAMLTRFGWICTGCALLLVVGWLLDGRFNRVNSLWKIQGALLGLALSLAAYLNFALLPQTIRDQKTILPILEKSEAKKPLLLEETAIRAQFDARHHSYTFLTQINLWLFVGVLALLMARGVSESSSNRVVK